ncbi:MAG: histidine phosphatase family protein [Gammaproteobacteria bacterium]|nr:histidine phosphatase family protein [Gammaproteobacteria bacterium]
MNQINKLFVLRHGKAAAGFSCPDFERELTDKGRRHAALVALWMLDNIHIPEIIICSPAQRTMQTAAIVANVFDFEPNQIIQHPEIYNASRQELLAVLAEYTHRFSRILLVGHNPGVESLVEYLCPELNYSLILQPTSLACLTSDDSWDQLERGSAQLTELVHSKSLT